MQDNPEELVRLDFEEQAARLNAGLHEKTYGLWGHIWHFTEYLHGLKYKHRFSKKKYLWLMLFTGWFGGHRYFQGRWGLGLIYTALSWTGLPLALCVTDFMEVIPIKADSDGYVIL